MSMSFARQCRRFFTGPLLSDRTTRPRQSFAAQTRQFLGAQAVIRCFYGFLLYLAIEALSELPAMEKRHAFAPLWPVVWLPWEHRSHAARAMLAALTIGSLLAALCPGPRFTRICAALGTLVFVAFESSFGKINHSLHLLLLVALLLAMLPTGWHLADRLPAARQRRLRQSTLLIFWTCQATILLSYTMSGLAKLIAALYQLGTGQLNSFFPGALGAHIAQRLLQTSSSSPFGAWIILHPWLSWPMMPVSIYLELFAFWAAFRPSILKPWVSVLILFHLGTYFTMTIRFPQNCFLLAIFFLASPDLSGTVTLRDRASHVPVFGGIWRLWERRKRHRTDALVSSFSRGRKPGSQVQAAGTPRRADHPPSGD